MRLRQFASVVLIALMATPPVELRSSPSQGSISGSVTLAGRPLSGASLAFLEVGSGNVVRATSAADGSLNLTLAAGRYVVATENQAGLVVARGPMVVSVAAGEVAAAMVELLALPGAMLQDAAPVTAAAQEPGTPGTGDLAPSPAPVTATTIQHDPIGCFIAGQFPLIPATVEPSNGIARARIYFKSASADAWFYVEMTPAEAGLVGKLPRPKLEASPITYYVQATTTQFGEAQTPEISAIVVEEATQCPEDKKIAPIGPPGEVTVFSAATGAAVAPAGFAAGGLALTAATLALLAGGAAAIGIGAAITVFNPEPTPSPSAQPTAPPSQEPPRPSPSPSPSPSIEPTPPPVTPFR
ncbi:MAG: carboxypeptidase-like regulatory domain-containing protein [bacterium]